jgi:iron complex outermembrane receptor protein
LFDKNYSSVGLYGEPDEAPGLGTLNDERFVGAGTPRAGWIGIKVSM